MNNLNLGLAIGSIVVIVLSIYNHLHNVSGLNVRIFHLNFVAKQFSAVEPSLTTCVHIFLGLHFI